MTLGRSPKKWGLILVRRHPKGDLVITKKVGVFWIFVSTSPHCPEISMFT